MGFDDPEAFPNGKKQQAALMAEAEKLLSAQDGENAWLFGSYSIADVVFTCMLCGLKMFDLVDLGEYPSVAKFYERVKKRPSYKAVGVFPNDHELLPHGYGLQEQDQIHLWHVRQSLAHIQVSECTYSCMHEPPASTYKHFQAFFPLHGVYVTRGLVSCTGGRRMWVLLFVVV